MNAWCCVHHQITFQAWFESDQDQINVNIPIPGKTKKNPAVAGKIVTFRRLSQRAYWYKIMGLLVSRIDGVAAGEVTRQHGFGFLPVGPVNRWSDFKFNF